MDDGVRLLLHELKIPGPKLQSGHQRDSGAPSGPANPSREEAARLRPPESEVRALCADASRLMQVTSWRPRTSLEDGLARTVAWWRERLASGGSRATASYVT